MPLHFPKGQLPVALALAALPAWCCTCSAQQPSPSPRQVQDAFREGVAAFSRNDLTTARAEFETVVRLAPSIQQGHSALGAVLVKLGETGAGIRELEKRLAMRADDTSALQNLAMAWEQIGQPAKACLGSRGSMECCALKIIRFRRRYLPPGLGLWPRPANTARRPRR